MTDREDGLRDGLARDADARYLEVGDVRVGSRYARELATLYYSEEHRGPLPSPRALEQYRNAHPEAPDRIIAMAEAQAAHRHELERLNAASANRRAERGQWMAFSLALAISSGAVYLISLGKIRLGAAMLMGELIGIVALFLYAEARKRSSLREKWRGLVGK